jgi:hypothetical protein
VHAPARPAFKAFLQRERRPDVVKDQDRELIELAQGARPPGGSTVSADQGYDVASFVAALRALDLTPHVVRRDRGSANRRSHDAARGVRFSSLLA